MDRDEILKKAQAGAIGMDEREQQVLVPTALNTISTLSRQLSKEVVK